MICWHCIDAKFTCEHVIIYFVLSLQVCLKRYIFEHKLKLLLWNYEVPELRDPVASAPSTPRLIQRWCFVLVCCCVECPPNCMRWSCYYNDTTEATGCARCDYGYVKRLSDGQCYGKYFVSDRPTNIIEPAKLAFGHQNCVDTPCPNGSQVKSSIL